MSVYTTELQELYVAYFNRPADVAGLAYWEQQRAKGVSLEAIAKWFGSSAGFHSLYDGKSHGQIVDAIYHNLFGRGADLEGMDYWKGQLDSGRLDNGNIALAIVNSVNSIDPAILANKAAAAQAFTAALVTPEQSGAYAGDAAFLPASAWLSTVNSNAATLSAATVAMPAALQAAVDAGLGKVAVSGSVADGYIRGATVFADTNGNGQWDQDEARGTTDAVGHFALTRAKGTLIASGGIDVATGKALSGSYTAPSGYSVISPLTTLVQAIVSANNLSAAQAEAMVKAKLGIAASVDLAHFDAIAAATAATAATNGAASADALASAVKVLAASAQVNLLMSQVGALLSGAGITADDNAGANAASKALAKLIAGASADVDLGSASVVAQLIQAAAVAAGATPAQTTVLNALTADASQVIAKLDHAVQLAAVAAPNGSGKAFLIEIAKIQYAADAVKTALESGAAAHDISFAKLIATDTALAAATANAAYHIGDVDGDAAPDAIPSPVVATTYTLTAGNDAVAGTTENDTINGTVAGAFAAGDSINGDGGTDTLTVSDSANLSTAGTTVVNVEIASLTSSGTVTANTSGWTGLSSLTTKSSGGATITAAASTAVTATDTTAGVSVTGGSTQAVSAAGAVTLSGATGAISVTETGAGQLAANIAVDGGTTVSVASIHQGGGLISIGGTTAPTGAVVVTSSVDAGQTGGAITVNGGSTVSVTQTASHAVGTTVTAESAVTVNGGASTSSVTVSQAAVAAAASAVTAVAGVKAVSAVTAVPGTQAVTAVSAITARDAVTAAAGVAVDGAVTIIDSKYNTAGANTIASVTLANYGAGSAIRDNALTTLSLSGTAGTLAITNATNGAGAVPAANSTLALSVNGLSGSNTITDTNNEITTLNVTATGADSSLAAFADTGLTTLHVTGDKVFGLNSINGSLTSIVISGAAGFNDGGTTAVNGFAARGAAATLVTTSSGAINISLNSTAQGFTGSTGVDTIRISSQTDASQIITGGSSASDELILEGGAFALSATMSAKVTGFEILGVAANVTGTVDMSSLASGFTKMHVLGNSSVTFSNVAATTSLALDVASTLVTVIHANATGPTDSISVSLGKATSDSVNFGTLVLKDSANVGIGTVNLVSNGVDITAGDAIANVNTVVLTDNGLSTLNVGGTQGLKITTINQATSQATSFTLNNTNTGQAGVTIGTLTDANLSTLNFTGTGLSTVTTLTDAGSSSVTINNTGTQLATVGTYTSSSNLTHLTLSSNVQIGNGLYTGTGLTATSTAGVQVVAGQDDAHLKLTLTGAASGNTDTLVLGNGNNVVIDFSTAGTVNLTIGTGSNYLALGGATTNTTGAYNITLGAHSAATGSDYIIVGTGGTAYATAANYHITGAVTGDRLIFGADGASSSAALTATTAGATLALTITAIENAAALAHGVAYAVFGGNTYVAESVSGVLGASDTALVELVGVHTLGASAGYVTIAS